MDEPDLRESLKKYLGLDPDASMEELCKNADVAWTALLLPPAPQILAADPLTEMETNASSMQP